MVFKWSDLMIRRTIQIPDILDHKTESLSCFQTIIRNLYHSTTGHVWNIWIPDLSVIQMVTVVCYSDPHFFNFQILDEVQRILFYIRQTPSLGRAFKVTDELFDLSTMAMEYFKEHIEPTLPEITYFGSEFLDFATPFTSKFSCRTGSKYQIKRAEL